MNHYNEIKSKKFLTPINAPLTELWRLKNQYKDSKIEGYNGKIYIDYTKRHIYKIDLYTGNEEWELAKPHKDPDLNFRAFNDFLFLRDWSKAYHLWNVNTQEQINIKDFKVYNVAPDIVYNNVYIEDVSFDLNSCKVIDFIPDVFAKNGFSLIAETTLVTKTGKMEEIHFLNLTTKEYWTSPFDKDSRLHNHLSNEKQLVFSIGDNVVAYSYPDLERLWEINDFKGNYNFSVHSKRHALVWTENDKGLPLKKVLDLRTGVYLWEEQIEWYHPIICGKNNLWTYEIEGDIRLFKSRDLLTGEINYEMELGELVGPKLHLDDCFVFYDEKTNEYVCLQGSQE